MVWTVTLEVLACADSAKLAGASVFDGTSTLTTDANGRLTFSREDTLSQFIVKISLAGYISKNKSLARMDAGTVRSECLNASPVGTNDPNVPTGAGGDHGGCFIVSATTGSASSAEVLHLRQLRDRVAARSAWGRELIARIYEDYASFSPALAGALAQDPFAKQAVLDLIVRPLLAWYSVAGVLALDQRKPAALNNACQAVLNSCPHPFAAGRLITLLEALRAGEPLPGPGHPLMHFFAPSLRAAAGLPFASWAILEPLLRVWRAAMDDRPDLVEQVAQWLAGAAIETLGRPEDTQQFEAELQALAAFFDFQPAARWHLGQRLLASWPEAGSALARTGFISEHQQA